MSNKIIKVFENEEFGEVRVTTVNGEPWFVGKEIAEILGYGNTRQALKTNVDDEDKVVHPVDTLGGVQKMTLINESGLYSLILSSKLPTAKKFKHWVTSDVLPSIRKNGFYSINQSEVKPDSYMIEDPIERAKRWIEEQKEKLALEEKIKQDAPLVEFANHVSDTSDLIDIATLSKIAKKNNIKIGRNKMFGWLRDNGYLISKGIHKNEPYQKYIDQGYFVVKEITYFKGLEICLDTKTFVTGKGQIYLIKELNKYFNE